MTWESILKTERDQLRIELDEQHELRAKAEAEIERAISGNRYAQLERLAIARAETAETEISRLRAKLAEVEAERDEWKTASFLSDCEAHSGQTEEYLARAEAAEARLAEAEKVIAETTDALATVMDRQDKDNKFRLPYEHPVAVLDRARAYIKG